MKSFYLNCTARSYIVAEITRARENPAFVSKETILRLQNIVSVCVAVRRRRSLRCASIPLFLAETKSERASKRAPHARLRTVSGPLSRSIAFTEEFQVAPSVQRAWNARMVRIYASVEIQACRVKTISDLGAATHPPSATHHDTCLHPRDAFTLIARTSTWGREDRDVTRMIYRSSSNIAARRSEEDPDEDIRLAIIQNTRGVIFRRNIYFLLFSFRSHVFFLFI